MQIIFWAIGTYVLLVLQTTCGQLIAVGPFVPNLLIALCVSCYCGSQSRWAVCGAAAWGLAVDALGSGPLGINLLSFTVITALFRPREESQAESPLRLILLTVIAVLALTSVELAAEWPWKVMSGRWDEFTIFIAGNSLYSLGVGLVGISAREVARHFTRCVGGINRRHGAWRHAALDR